MGPLTVNRQALAMPQALVAAEIHQALDVHRDVAAKLLTIDPSIAARKIVDGVERRKPRVLIGFSAYALDVVARVAPGSYGVLLRKYDELLDQRARATAPVD